MVSTSGSSGISSSHKYTGKTPPSQACQHFRPAVWYTETTTIDGAPGPAY
jgi:hypothetical protein